jgi:hypothetical protein
LRRILGEFGLVYKARLTSGEGLSGYVAVKTLKGIDKGNLIELPFFNEKGYLTKLMSMNYSLKVYK